MAVTFSNRLSALLPALVLTTVLACITQSAFNLSAIAPLSGGISPSAILATIWFDLRHFSLTYAPIALINLSAVALVLYVLPVMRRYWLSAMIGAALLYLMLQLINAIAPMPTLIAATRSTAGLISMLLCSSAGALCYVVLVQRRDMHG